MPTRERETPSAARALGNLALGLNRGDPAAAIQDLVAATAVIARASCKEGETSKEGLRSTIHKGFDELYDQLDNIAAKVKARA